jgi:hypothetical protein
MRDTIRWYLIHFSRRCVIWNPQHGGIMGDSSSSNGIDNDNGEDLGILPFDDGSAGRIIRKVWHDGRWFFSVVDVVAVLTDSTDPGAYWRKLKQRLTDEGSEVVTNCHGLKMRAIDGKMRATDAADTETMLRIVQSIPSPKAEPFKQWLANVGAQTLDQAAADMTEAQKRLLLRGDVADKNTALNVAANLHGLESGRDFAIFHDMGYKGMYRLTAAQIAVRRDIPKGEILNYMGQRRVSRQLVSDHPDRGQATPARRKWRHRQGGGQRHPLHRRARSTRRH